MRYVVKIGNTSIRMDSDGGTGTAIFRAKQWFPGLDPSEFSARQETSADGRILFIDHSNLDSQKPNIYKASGLAQRWSSETDMGGTGGTGGIFNALNDGRLPTPDNLGPGAQPVLPPSPGGALEQQAPFGAFTNFLGRYAGLGSDDPRSAARTFAESQFNPNLSAFQGRTLAEGLPEGVGQANAFQSFLGEGGGGFSPRQKLGDAFRSLQAAAPGADSQSDLGLALNAQNEGEFEQLFDLASNLQASNTSPLVSRAFRNSRGNNWENFNRFAAQRQAGGGQNALSYLRDKFGLGGLGF